MTAKDAPVENLAPDRGAGQDKGCKTSKRKSNTDQEIVKKLQSCSNKIEEKKPAATQNGSPHFNKANSDASAAKDAKNGGKFTSALPAGSSKLWNVELSWWLTFGGLIVLALATRLYKIDEPDHVWYVLSSLTWDFLNWYWCMFNLGPCRKNLARK